jgi:ketosteroid isomerase-like protein
LRGAPNQSWPLALLAVSIAALPLNAGVLFPDTRAEAPAVAIASTTEAAIEAQIRDWLARLAASPADARALAMFSREPSFEVSLPEGNADSPKELETWLAELRSADSHVEFLLDSIRIVPEGEGSVRAHFEVERRSRGALGALHIVRWHQTWWLRTSADGTPSVLRIEQHPVLPFPGTGPRIVCD